MICSLIILADRGGFKAYDVTETPTRGPSLRLVHDFEITGSERELPFNVESSRRRVTLISDWPALDPTKVVRVALENAVSVASVLLLTEATLTELPEPKEHGGTSMPSGME